MLYFYNVLTIVDSDTVWRALSSPHRRRLLDALRDGPRTTGQLVRELPALSRFAVMQHLGVLGEANLVLFRKEGRTRLNYANPIPLRELYERWVLPPASIAAETDLHLKRYAESTHKVERIMNEPAYRHIKIETETPIAAPPEKVFAALTSEYDAWWPHRYKPDSRCSVDPEPGGFYHEHFSNGGGAITGTILYVDAPNKLIAGGPSSLGRGINSYNVQNILSDGKGGSVLKRSMELWGTVSDELEKMFREGTKQLLDDALIGYLEHGKTYVPEAAE